MCACVCGPAVARRPRGHEGRQGFEPPAALMKPWRWGSSRGRASRAVAPAAAATAAAASRARDPQLCACARRAADRLHECVHGPIGTAVQRWPRTACRFAVGSATRCSCAIRRCSSHPARRASRSMCCSHRLSARPAQRDGCTLLRPRWGAGRMMHPPGRLLYIGKLRFLLPRRVTRYRHCHAPPSSNSVSEGNLAASQFEPAVASRRSQRVPSIKPREVVAWASRTRCRVTVRRLCTARTVASAAKRHFLTFLDFYGDLNLSRAPHRCNLRWRAWSRPCAKHPTQQSHPT